MIRSRPTRARGLKLAESPASPDALGSRPTRARGLKQYQAPQRRRPDGVAPHAGARIETTVPPSLRAAVSSRPTRARGLKHVEHRRDGIRAGVAPHAGARIETRGPWVWQTASRGPAHADTTAPQDADELEVRTGKCGTIGLAFESRPQRGRARIETPENVNRSSPGLHIRLPGPPRRADWKRCIQARPFLIALAEQTLAPPGTARACTVRIGGRHGRGWRYRAGVRLAPVTPRSGVTGTARPYLCGSL